MGQDDRRSAEAGSPGSAREAAPSVQDVYDHDRGSVPDALREVAYEFLGDEDLPTDAYTSRAFHALEVERLWPRVWQMATREESIPNVGDHVVYEIGDTSLIVVRSGPDEIRAYHNSCPHRGTQLRAEDGHVEKFRCPFHNFTWNLDGTLAHIPCEWDFPHVRAATFSLPEARVACWGGFVFVNLDPEAISLEAYLERVPEHFRRWSLEDRFLAAHVAKVIECNWKVALDAFVEVFHLAGLHPESLPILGDTNSQYDVWPDSRHTNRMINVSGTASPQLHGFSEQRVLKAAGEFGLCAPGLELPEGARARDVIEDAMRERLQSDLGIDVAAYSTGEVLDVIQYSVFPNVILFGGLGSPLAYRIRPHGHDPNECVFEVMMLLPLPEGASRPAAAAPIWLERDQRWASVKELSYFGAILDQDFDMMPRVQRGLRASAKGTITLANYQEVRIRHFRRVLMEYLAD